MKNHIYSFLFLIGVLVISSCGSSKPTTTQKTIEEKSLYSTWYLGERISTSRIKIDEKLLVSQKALTADLTTTSEKELNEFNWSTLDTLKIEKTKFVKDKNTVFAIISKKKEQLEYKGISIENTPIDGMKLMLVTDKHYFTLQEAENDIDTIAFKEILQVPIFKETFAVSSLKPVKDFTKEDYIIVINYMHSIEPSLKRFSDKLQEEQEENYEAMMEKIVQDNFTKKVYLLGYNPYESDESPFAEFNQDPEIMELLQNGK